MFVVFSAQFEECVYSFFSDFSWKSEGMRGPQQLARLCVVVAGCIASGDVDEPKFAIDQIKYN